jgi:arsenate reductase (glutaredoxin)
MIKIYHNPRCKKSRSGVEYLKQKGLEFSVVEYMKEPFSIEGLKEVLAKLNLSPQEIIREQEEIYKKQFKGKSFTHEEWIKILIEHPNLIKRPIVVKDYKAVWADPPENIEKLFKMKK